MLTREIKTARKGILFSWVITLKTLKYESSQTDKQMWQCPLIFRHSLKIDVEKKG